MYVRHETSYDAFFADADRIYKMALERKYPNYTTFYSPVPHSFAPSIQRDFPEVENTLLMQGPVNNSVITYRSKDDEVKSFEEDFILFADSAFFSFFDVRLLQGDKKTALAFADQVIISQSTASSRTACRAAF